MERIGVWEGQTLCWSSFGVSKNGTERERSGWVGWSKRVNNEVKTGPRRWSK